jgi:hypothetical protein
MMKGPPYLVINLDSSMMPMAENAVLDLYSQEGIIRGIETVRIAGRTRGRPRRHGNGKVEGTVAQSLS